MDHTPILLMPGVLSLAWGGTVRLLADGLGLTLDEIREQYEKRAADETFTTKPGTVEKGTMAGLRFEVQGIVGGKARVVVEHVTRMHNDVAPDWPEPPGKGGYRVLIAGSPRMTCEFTLEGDGGDENSGGLIVTAMRLVNAIPAVCAAKPGLLSVLDLPTITGRGLLAT
jgi:4-hydroxy-tetrahydrodipicolinate reductase